MSNETENLYRTYQQGLDDIKASITSTTTDQIDTRQAEKAGIKQHRISLNQDENRPQYFIPFDQIIPLSDLNYPTFQADSNFYARSLHGYIKNLFTEVYQDEYPVQPGICYVPYIFTLYSTDRMPILTSSDGAIYPSKSYSKSTVTGACLSQPLRRDVQDDLISNVSCPMTSSRATIDLIAVKS